MSHGLLLFVISKVSPAKVRVSDGFRLSLLMIVDIKLNTVHHDNHNLRLKLSYGERARKVI